LSEIPNRVVFLDGERAGLEFRKKPLGHEYVVVSRLLPLVRLHLGVDECRELLLMVNQYVTSFLRGQVRAQVRDHLTGQAVEQVAMNVV